MKPISSSNSEEQKSLNNNMASLPLGETEPTNERFSSLSKPVKTKQYWSLKKKVTLGAIALSMLPVLILGAVTYSRERSPNGQIDSKQLGEVTAPNTTPPTTINSSLWLLLATGTIAGLAGTLAFLLAEYLLNPILKSMTVSTKIVNRLFPEEIKNSTFLSQTDELTTLAENLRLIEGQLPELLWKEEVEKERYQQLLEITYRLQQSRSQEEVLRNTVEEVRRLLKADRVAVLYLDLEERGTFIAESVAPRLPKILWATVEYPYFEPEYWEDYSQGKVRAIDDIYQAGLSDRYVGLLERFAVKANLIAPILRQGKLFALLIAHQCSAPRYWQPAEIDLLAQIANKVGFALDHANLLEQLDLRAVRAQQFLEITRQIRTALTEEEILKVAVEQMQKALNAERVIVYSFDEDWYGTVVAEAVVPGFPKALWAEIRDPCFAEGYVEKYQQGRVQATGNVYEAGLTECHLQQLEPFAVKANLVAPILKDEKLFGLLIAHQCSAPRHWQQSEIDLITQIASQVGLTLDRARLLQQLDTEGRHSQLLATIALRIRETLVVENVLKTAVEEVRKALNAERVIVYSFDENWYGTVVAEAVVPGFPKALWAEIRDPCFAEGYVEKYQQGRVQATGNVYEAGLTECHLQQLEPFAVKANLVAPILKDKKLFGLLIAHQCSAPRHWQQWEINFLKQIALQVGFAVEHCRLLQQTERAYQQSEKIARQQSRQKETLLHQVSKLLSQNETAIANLTERAVKQQAAITAVYEQIQALTDTARVHAETAAGAEIEEQYWQQTIAATQKTINQSLSARHALQKLIFEVNRTLKPLDHCCQQLTQQLNVMSNTIAQIKLQGMNVVLESARERPVGQELGTVAQKIHALAQKLDHDLSETKPILTSLQTNTQQVTAVLAAETELTDRESQLGEKSQQQLEQISKAIEQMKILMSDLTGNAAQQKKSLKTIGQSVLEIAHLIGQTSEQSLNMAQSFTHLKTIVQQLSSNNADITNK